MLPRECKYKLCTWDETPCSECQLIIEAKLAEWEKDRDWNRYSPEGT